MQLEEETKALIDSAKESESKLEWKKAKNFYLDAASNTLKIAKESKDGKLQHSYEVFTKILIEKAKECQEMSFEPNLPGVPTRKQTKKKNQLLIRKTPDVYALFVIKEGGTPALTHHFSKLKDKVQKEINEVLFSGALTAISQLMREAFERPVQKIDFDQGVLLIQQHGNVSFILYAEETSPGLKKSLKKFASGLSEMGYQIESPVFFQDLSHVDEVKQLIGELFISG